jgi:hypothetical protein
MKMLDLYLNVKTALAITQGGLGHLSLKDFGDLAKKTRPFNQEHSHETILAEALELGFENHRAAVIEDASKWLFDQERITALEVVGFLKQIQADAQVSAVPPVPMPGA